MKKLLLTSILLCFLIFGAKAQQVSYAELVNRSSVPVFFVDELMLPAKDDSTVQFSLIFKLSNDFVNFKKIGNQTDLNAPRNTEFYSTIRLSSELTKSEKNKNSRENLVPAARDVWQDTLYAKNYDETQSKERTTNGFLSSNLAPGEYSYLLQLNILGAASDRNSNRQNIKIKDFSNSDTGELFLLKNDVNIDSLQFPLLNLGDNVLYGDDFNILVRLPKYSDSNSYYVEIAHAELDRKGPKIKDTIYKENLNPDQIYQNVYATLESPKNPSISLHKNDGKHAYALLKIPNSTFKNSVYQVSIKSDKQKDAVAERIVSSYWPDMPPSLLNLDISIDLLKFIVSPNELKQLKKGNANEKEEKFRKFWADKDPTPDTEFNELMTEYYRRIDHAFKEFRNPENPNGYDTDRGEVYIKFGPPNSTERKFPDKGKVVEIWEYPNRTFIFEKGTGFSDFKLIGQE